MRFKPGQKVVCVQDSKWSVVDNPIDAMPDNGDPSYGEVVTVESFDQVIHGVTFINLVEYPPNSYDEDEFKPLMDISELTEILEQQPQEI